MLKALSVRNILLTGLLIPGLLLATEKELTVTAKLIHQIGGEAGWTSTGENIKNMAFKALFAYGIYDIHIQVDALTAPESNTVEVNYQVFHAPWYKILLGYTQIANGQTTLTLGDQGCSIPLDKYAYLAITAR